MTRALFTLAAALLICMALLFIGGFSGNTPGLLMAGLLLAGPGFLFTLGLAIGRASKEIAIVRKDDAEYRSSANSRVVTRGRTREPLS